MPSLQQVLVVLRGGDRDGDRPSVVLLDAAVQGVGSMSRAGSSLHILHALFCFYFATTARQEAHCLP